MEKKESRKALYSLPDVQQFQGIEQDPSLHFIINLLIRPKTRSSIDLEINTRECFVGVAFFFLSFFLSYVPRKGGVVNTVVKEKLFQSAWGQTDL